MYIVLKSNLETVTFNEVANNVVLVSSSSGRSSTEYTTKEAIAKIQALKKLNFEEQEDNRDY
jgi:hypothetical protein